MKRSDIAELFAKLQATYLRDFPDEALEEWLRVLADVDAEAALRAFDEIAATSEFPPTAQRVRALALSLDVPFFYEVWAELVEAANTCDYFDQNPPRSLSPAAYALARTMQWSDFRVSNPDDTYYQHQARERFAEITDRVKRRIAQGLPGFVQAPGLEGDERLTELVADTFAERDE